MKALRSQQAEVKSYYQILDAAWLAQAEASVKQFVTLRGEINSQPFEIGPLELAVYYRNFAVRYLDPADPHNQTQSNYSRSTLYQVWHVGTGLKMAEFTDEKDVFRLLYLLKELANTFDWEFTEVAQMSHQLREAGLARVRQIEQHCLPCSNSF